MWLRTGAASCDLCFGGGRALASELARCSVFAAALGPLCATLDATATAVVQKSAATSGFVLPPSTLASELARCSVFAAALGLLCAT